MSLQERFEAAFDQALARAAQGEGDLERERPNAIAKSVCVVLQADGAAIGVAHDDRRIPLGANNSDAALAESLEFTVGDGPCLQAMRTELIVDAPAQSLAHRWPVLSELWRERTPFRSAASLPLLFPGMFSGVLNLFFRHEQGARFVDASSLKLTELLATQLLADWVKSNKDDVEQAWQGAQALARGQVSVAIGMIMQTGGLDGPDALAVIRAFAFGHDLTVDKVSERLVDGRLTVGVVTG